MKLQVVALLCLAALVHGQQAGTLTPEEHLGMSMQNCESGSCTTVSTKLVLDSNWRWTHDGNGYENCYTGNQWNSALCPDSATCTQNCVVDGVDSASWTGTYGISAQGDSLSLKFVTQGPYSTNIGSRVYLMADDSKYQMFKLKNREFIIDVDSSGLPCGLNGAMYFVEMEEDGGASSYGNAGAAYGLGYCDAQCPHDMKFIAGQANVDGWVPSPDDPNSGTGAMGICCFEMDIWEANSQAQSFTPHDCNVQGYYPCSGTECGDNEASKGRYDGVCDKDGCDFAAYRINQHNFYGPGMTVDSSQKITLITQFITSDGTDSGDLVEIRRIYQQNGQTIQNAAVNFDGVTAYDSVTDAYCTEIKDYFGDVQDFAAKGGMKAMGDALDRGMVLVMSLWDDHFAFMHWLDAHYPDEADPSVPGILRGPCPISGGHPEQIEAENPDATVTFSGIKVGPIQSY